MIGQIQERKVKNRVGTFNNMVLTIFFITVQFFSFIIGRILCIY